jgi:hypothetical protein
MMKTTAALLLLAGVAAAEDFYWRNDVAWYVATIHPACLLAAALVDAALTFQLCGRGAAPPSQCLPDFRIAKCWPWPPRQPTFDFVVLTITSHEQVALQ